MDASGGILERLGVVSGHLRGRLGAFGAPLGDVLKTCLESLQSLGSDSGRPGDSPDLLRTSWCPATVLKLPNGSCF